MSHANSPMNIQQKTYPDWLYNALPFAYLGVGVLTALVLANTVGVVVGISGLIVAVVIWFSRWRYRQAFVHAEELMDLPTMFGKNDLPDGGWVQMSWNKTLECGHPLVDGQHRRMFGLANEAIDCLLTHQPVKDEEALLNELIEHMIAHFATEEALLAQAFDPGLDDHRDQHKAMLARARELLQKFHDGQVISKELVSFLSQDVIIGHITKEDLSLVAALH